MALVAYLDWEVRTTGHDLNCSGFNPNRDPTNGVDYTQQDNAEIISRNWTVDATNNTWIRSTELTNWVNSGKVLASLKGNHIHIAGKAIGGNTLFQWVASTAVPGAYYLQALGGGNPNWTTKPTRFWMNKVFVLENTSLPSGTDSWTYGDKDSLGYSTIYVRFGAENDADPNAKAQDDIIADGQTWTRGAYEVVNVGTDGNGPYLVLDRSPAAASSTAGYGRIGGAMASSGGVAGLSSNQIVVMRPGIYYVRRTTSFNSTPESIGNAVRIINRGNQSDVEIIATYTGGQNDSIGSTIINCVVNSLECNNTTFILCKINRGGLRNGILIACHVTGTKLYDTSSTAIFSYLYNTPGWYNTTFGTIAFSIVHGRGVEIIPSRIVNSVLYGCTSNPLLRSSCLCDSCVFINNSGQIFSSSVSPHGSNNFGYGNTLGIGVSNPDFSYTDLPGNPFRDPDNGDFRLADNEAGRMLKQAGFQIPGPQGAPPMKFDVGAVQNSFYDIASGGVFVLPPRTIGA